MAGSCALFIIALLICFGLAHTSEKYNNIKPLILIIVLLSLVSGMRGYSVGFDTRNYANYFELIARGDSNLAFGLEGTYKQLCLYVSKIWNNPTSMFLLCAIITNAMVILRLWDFREKGSISWMVLTYYTMFYFSTMNIMRQMCAVAIIFYATRFIQAKKYFKYLLFLGIAFIFHNSALIGAIFLATEVLLWKYLNKKQRIIIALMIILSPLGISYVYLSGVFDRYSHYFNATAVNIGLMLFLKLIVFLLTAIDIHNKKNNEQIFDDYKFKSVRIYYFIGIIITGTGYFYSVLQRIGLPFYIFETVYWGIAVKTCTNKGIYKSFILAIMSYVFILNLISNGHGVIPYTTVF